MSTKIQFRHQVDRETWIGLIYAYWLENSRQEADLRKGAIVNAIEAFWLPFAAQKSGVQGSELEEIVRRSLVALDAQRQLITAEFSMMEFPARKPVADSEGCDRPSTVTPLTGGNAALTQQDTGVDWLIDDHYLMEDEL